MDLSLSLYIYIYMYYELISYVYYVYIVYVLCVLCICICILCVLVRWGEYMLDVLVVRGVSVPQNINVVFVVDVCVFLTNLNRNLNRRMQDSSRIAR